jgi:hypothetical protein
LSVAEWRVHRYDLERSWPDLPDAVAGYAEDLASWVRRAGGRHGQRFLLGPEGFPDVRVNAFLASPRMRSLAGNTQRDYAYSLALWLNFLVALGCPWWEAGEDEAEEFQFWRLTDPENDQRVGASAYSKDLAACKKFYKWAAGRYPTVADPFAGVEFPVARKMADVKWLDPAAIVRWRDLGVRGRGLDGRRDRSWRGRNEQRDAAFVDGLYGTGLRLAEWSSVVLPELPRLAPGREYYTCALADACAKGGFGHSFWMPRSVLVAVCAYIEGARARAVREAQAAGRYEGVRRLRVVSQTRGREWVVLEDGAGGTVERRWEVLGPERRQKLFSRTAAGLEPVWLWLNEDGMPRDAHGWQHTFTGANARIAALGLQDFSATAHMMRHSFALKWFSIGKLVNASRLAHLDEEEVKDFREQFGNSWHLVQTMLGHRRVETTKNVYLEPFRKLDVELLLAHAAGFPVVQFMAEAFASHPQVRTDPLAAR